VEWGRNFERCPHYAWAHLSEAEQESSSLIHALSKLSMREYVRVNGGPNRSRFKNNQQGRRTSRIWRPTDRQRWDEFQGRSLVTSLIGSDGHPDVR
jgi:hypothetical protein